MPDHRRHRGRHPEDDRLFGRGQWERLRLAVSDLSWLLSREYAGTSAVKLVGDRYALTQRQRLAVTRASCSDAARADRARREVTWQSVREEPLAIDGFNVITTIEAALAGGIVFRSRDGCLRDMASVHGTYRSVMETPPAVEMIAQTVAMWRPSACVWYLDAPVSNSGRLAKLIREVGENRQLGWEVSVVNNPDAELSNWPGVVATADSAVLDRCGRWINLARYVLAENGAGRGGQAPIQVIDLKVAGSSDA